MGLYELYCFIGFIYRVYMASYGFMWVYVGFYGFLWVYMSYMVYMVFYELMWVYMDLWARFLEPCDKCCKNET